MIALDAASGRTLWEHTYDAPILRGLNVEYGPGPHSTPLVAGERVFAVGSTGRMHALDRRTGRVLWAQDLTALGGEVHDRGYACSPLAYGSTVITTLGAPGQALVAFDQATGRVAVEGRRLRRLAVLAPDRGRGRPGRSWSSSMPTVSPASTPQPAPRSGTIRTAPNTASTSACRRSGHGNVLVISSAYSGGSRGLRLARAGARTTVTELWSSNRLRVHFAPLVRLGDRVYASSGDFGPAFVTAADVATGAIAWQERGFARASVVAIGDKLLILDEDGVLALATPRADGLTVHARAEVLDGQGVDRPHGGGDARLPPRPRDGQGDRAGAVTFTGPGTSSAMAVRGLHYELGLDRVDSPRGE